MGIENLIVRFDDPSGVFYAGQTISGVVQFQTTQPYQSDGVFIKFLGRADVHWTERQSTRKSIANVINFYAINSLVVEFWHKIFIECGQERVKL